MRTTCLYLRVSTADQRHDSQEDELARYCSLRGWVNPKVYRDTISGAASTRPSLDELIRDARSGKVERIIVYKLDRLGRSLTHLALILDELNRLQIPLICASQGIDTSNDNPAGRLQLGVLMAVAEFERGIIKERVRAGLASAKCRGVKLGRPVKLQARAAEVLALRAKGLGVCAVSRQLGMPLSSVHKIFKMAT